MITIHANESAGPSDIFLATPSDILGAISNLTNIVLQLKSTAESFDMRFEAIESALKLQQVCISNG